MAALYNEDQKYTNTNFTEKPLTKGEYERCTFTNCTFYDADISQITFSECVFEQCDMSLSNCKNTSFNNVKFLQCRLVGIHFEETKVISLSVYFENCIMQLASFYGIKLRNSTYKNCNLQEVDFTDSDISGSLFENCDLAQAIFDNTNIEKADFRTSFNYSINPNINKIKKAMFSNAGIVGLLDSFNIIVE